MDALTFDATTSNLASGIVVFKGQTIFPDGGPAFTRVTLHFLALGGAPLSVVDPSTIGAPASIGGALLIPSPGNGFMFNFVAEAAPASGGPYLGSPAVL